MSRSNRAIFGAVLSAVLLMQGHTHAANDDDRRLPDELSLFGGGWDLNGPAISGTHTPGATDFGTDDRRNDETAPSVPQRRRGGWDGNGPSISGHNEPAPAAAELDMDHLTVEAVILPKN